jgi:alpha-D-ribose 1-methylphosphonate 5-triphosphate synthase subunit PhnH
LLALDAALETDLLALEAALLALEAALLALLDTEDEIWLADEAREERV